MVGVHPAGQAKDGAARIRVPVRRTETGKGRNHIHAVGIFHFSGKIFGIEGVVDQLHFIAQPLNRGAGHEYCAFQRIVHFPTWAAADSGQQAMR